MITGHRCCSRISLHTSLKALTFPDLSFDSLLISFKLECLEHDVSISSQKNLYPSVNLISSRLNKIVLMKTSSLCEARRDSKVPFFRFVIASILVVCS